MKTLSRIISVLIVTAVISTATSCKAKETPPDPQFVAAVTSGIIGRNDPVIIEFVQNRDTEKRLPSNAVSLRPSVKGEVSWQNDYTLVFTPSGSYKPGQQYQVNVNVPDVPPFNFNFTAAVPVFSVQLEPIKILNANEIAISGYVNTDDDIDFSKLEKTIESRELGKPVWANEDGIRRFVFTVSRSEASRTAEITWNASYIGSAERGFTTVVIPGIDNFEMLGLRLCSSG